MEHSKLNKGEFKVVVEGEFSRLCDLQNDVVKRLGFQFLNLDDFYLMHNGKVLRDDDQVENAINGRDQSATVNLVLRVLGGKGGFGSMLRAIGAQIEKTTNRDACRDLSGRRLRDINEEQRLKKWFAKQAEREQEKQEARKRKLEKLRVVADGPSLPKIDDQEYLQKREDIVEAVFEAVDEGTSTSSGSKTDTKPKEEVKKTFKKTMFEEDLDSASSSDDGEEDEEIPSKVAKLA